MSDPFVFNATGLDSPALRVFAVTPSDSVDFTNACRALYIGGDGNVTLVTPAGDVATFVGLTAGAILPVRTARVNATATTATNIVGLW